MIASLPAIDISLGRQGRDQGGEGRRAGHHPHRPRDLHQLLPQDCRIHQGDNYSALEQGAPWAHCGNGQTDKAICSSVAFCAYKERN